MKKERLQSGSYSRGELGARPQQIKERKFFSGGEEEATGRRAVIL